jgi:DNA-binding transcriptional LysR family regulator
VRIAAPMSFGIAHVGPALPAFFAEYPDVEIDLHCSDEVIDLIGGGFDLALRIADLPDSSLLARRLCPVGRQLVGAPSYFARHGRPQHPRDLAHHACLGYAYLPTQGWRFVNAAGEEAAVRPTGPLRTNNADVLLPALLSGLGLAVQPDFMIWEHLAVGRLETVMTDWSMPPIALNIVTPPGGHRPARVTAVIDFLAKHFANPAWSTHDAG